jgi:hypothetical protein
MSAKETERERLEQRLHGLAAVTAEGVEKLGRAVRKACREAREAFAQFVDPARLNRFVEDRIGPMTLTRQGLLVPKTTQASANAEACVTSAIAGAGFEPATSGL